jgi:hypothetical protein
MKRILIAVLTLVLTGSALATPKSKSEVKSEAESDGQKVSNRQLAESDP